MKFTLIIDKEKEEEVCLTLHEPSPLAEQIEALVNRSQKLLGYREDETKPLAFEEIVCITVLDGKTAAICADGTQYRLRLRLYEAEKVLPPSFVRINKSAIGNEAHLLRFVATAGGGIDALFRGGYREYVSRRCFAEIKRRFKTR